VFQIADLRSSPQRIKHWKTSDEKRSRHLLRQEEFGGIKALPLKQLKYLFTGIASPINLQRLGQPEIQLPGIIALGDEKTARNALRRNGSTLGYPEGIV
jgi:hypothetical protein